MAEETPKSKPTPTDPSAEEQQRVGFVRARDERSIFAQSLEAVKNAMRRLAGKHEKRD